MSKFVNSEGMVKCYRLMKIYWTGNYLKEAGKLGESIEMAVRKAREYVVTELKKQDWYKNLPQREYQTTMKPFMNFIQKFLKRI